MKKLIRAALIVAIIIVASSTLLDLKRIKTNDIPKVSLIDQVEEKKAQYLVEEEPTPITLVNDFNSVTSYDINNLDVGIIYYNPQTQEYLEYNPDTYYWAGSIIKVAIATFLADDITNGRYSLDDTIIYNDSFYEEGTGIMMSDPYGEYTIEELIKLMLIYSDNIACNMLLSLFDPGEFTTRMDELTEGNYNTAENKITTYGAYKIILNLYENNSPYYADIRDLLKQTVFDDRSSLYLDNDLVAHKIGNLYSNFNDIAIIYGESPFILSVMCNDTYEICNEFIGDLTKNIFDIYN